MPQSTSTTRRRASRGPAARTLLRPPSAATASRLAQLEVVLEQPLLVEVLVDASVHPARAAYGKVKASSPSSFRSIIRQHGSAPVPWPSARAGTAPRPA